METLHSCYGNLWKEEITLINPLTTDDKCTCHSTLVACYPLVQSVLKKILCKVGLGLMSSTRQPSLVAVERPCLALAGPC